MVLKEARFYHKLKDKRVRCGLCAWRCTIPDSGIGNCRVRKNANGRLYSLVYGRVVSTAVDPIEKKPLYHFRPGSSTFSIATVGCNLHCLYCQNWEIAQPAVVKGRTSVWGENYTPKQVVDAALRYGTQGVSYTYTEPAIFYEFAYDCMKLARKKGLYNVFVTNGYIEKEPLEEAAEFLDAANVDVKALSDAFYKKLCLVPGHKPVLKTVKRMQRLGVHVEVTNLMIPGWNDSERLVKKLVNWLARLNPLIPLHFSRFHPAYKMLDASPTPIKTLERAYRLAKEAGLKHVYIGNIPSNKWNNTFCPKCGTLVIEREGYSVSSMLKKGACPKCGERMLKPEAL